MTGTYSSDVPADPLARAVRSRRVELGLSLGQVAARAGCAKSYLSMLERGVRAGPIGDEVRSGLEAALNLPAGSLASASALRGTPAPIRDRLRDLEHAQSHLRVSALLALAPRGCSGRSLDEAFRSGRLNELVSRLDPVSEPVGQRSVPTAGSLTVGEALPVQVPLINKVPAGDPVEFTDLGYPSRSADEYCRTVDPGDPDAFAARVVGDSMEPEYRAGDIVVFSPLKAVRSGCDCFVRLEPDQETTFKRVYLEPEAEGSHPQSVTHIRLTPLNPKYPSRVVPREQVAGMFAAVSVTRTV